MNLQAILKSRRSGYALWVIAAMLLLALIGPGPALAEIQDEHGGAVEALGVSKIYKGNVINARQAATEDSFEYAVAMVVAQIMPADVLASNFQAVNAAVLAKAESFVSGFQVLAEAQAGSHLRIMTRVRVDRPAIQEALRSGGALTEAENLPVLLFLVNEKELGQSAPRHWWGKAVSQALTPQTETIMAGKLAEKGFTSVDGRDAIRTMVSGPQFDPERFDLSAAMELARGANAQVVIFGDASARHAAAIPGTNMASYEGVISVQAVNADTGEQIAFSTQNVTAVADNSNAGGKEALERAASQAAQELSLGLLAAYQTQSAGPVTLELKVTGISPLANFVAFRRALKNETEGVTRVLPKGMTDKEARLIVEYKGLPQNLARDLTLRVFDRFSVHVSYIGSDAMDVRLLPKTQSEAGLGDEMPGEPTGAE